MGPDRLPNSGERKVHSSLPHHSTRPRLSPMAGRVSEGHDRSGLAHGADSTLYVVTPTTSSLASHISRNLRRSPYKRSFFGVSASASFASTRTLTSTARRRRRCRLSPLLEAGRVGARDTARETALHR